eukprot:g3229.t1
MHIAKSCHCRRVPERPDDQHMRECKKRRAKPSSKGGSCGGKLARLDDLDLDILADLQRTEAAATAMTTAKMYHEMEMAHLLQGGDASAAAVAASMAGMVAFNGAPAVAGMAGTASMPGVAGMSSMVGGNFSGPGVPQMALNPYMLAQAKLTAALPNKKKPLTRHPWKMTYAKVFVRALEKSERVAAFAHIIFKVDTQFRGACALRIKRKFKGALGGQSECSGGTASAAAPTAAASAAGERDAAGAGVAALQACHDELAIQLHVQTLSTSASASKGDATAESSAMGAAKHAGSAGAPSVPALLATSPAVIQQAAEIPAQDARDKETALREALLCEVRIAERLKIMSGVVERVAASVSKSASAKAAHQLVQALVDEGGIKPLASLSSLFVWAVQHDEKSDPSKPDLCDCTLRTMRIQLIVQEEKKSNLLADMHRQELLSMTSRGDGDGGLEDEELADYFEGEGHKGAAVDEPDRGASGAAVAQHERELFERLTRSSMATIVEDGCDGDANGGGGGVDAGVGATNVRAAAMLEALRREGILEDDARLLLAYRQLKLRDELDLSDFSVFLGKNLLVGAALGGQLVIPRFSAFCASVVEMYTAVEPHRGGAVADYIPALAAVEPEQWAVAVCTVDGQRFSHGDAAVPFCVQSSSKPVTYCIALELHGEEKVHRHIGREPSGRRFNERVLKQPDGVPHNPYINAGAIMAASLVHADMREDHRFDYVTSVWSRLAGYPEPPIGFQNSTYMGERATAARNFCLGYMMAEEEAFPAGTDLIATLESYFMYCSLEVTAEQMAVVAATLANSGICPTTGERVFRARTVRNALCLMMSCGMYDYSGEYAFKVGIPTKSGVSGVLCIVVPGITGIATFSPRLDRLGNSVRGQAFLGGGRDAFDIERRELTAMWNAAAAGDAARVRALAVRGVDTAAADYDRRTALHLAASNGHAAVVRLLLQLGADPWYRDRHGNVALDDATREGHAEAQRVLERAGAAKDSLDAAATPPPPLVLRERGVSAAAKGGSTIYPAHHFIGGGGSLADTLRAVGIAPDSVTVAAAVAAVDAPEANRTSNVSLRAALDASAPATVALRALAGSLAVPNWATFVGKVSHLFEASRRVDAGTLQATHIPQLRAVDASLAGLGLCTVDGQRLNLGDSAALVSSQALLRPFAYVAALATDAVGFDRVHAHVGCEPAGDASTAVSLNENDQPYNPFSISGALLVACLLRGSQQPSYVLRQLLALLQRACGLDEPPALGADVYAAELANSDVHRCVAYLMLTKGTFPLAEVAAAAGRGAGTGAGAGAGAGATSGEEASGGEAGREGGREGGAAGPDEDAAVEAAVRLYMMLNAIELNCESLAVLAGTFAGGGVCPLTGERVLPADAVKNTLCFMQSCGFYTESGEFAFSVGFPAMGSAAGAVMVVVPNLLGACYYNPVINGNGLPVRGVQFCRALSDTFRFHMYDKDAHSDKVDPALYRGHNYDLMINALLSAASGGDLSTMRTLHAQNFNLGTADYDMRSAAHLAASEGHANILTFLAENGVSLERCDRWGNTPLDDAKREGHTAIVTMLQRWFDRA